MIDRFEVSCGFLFFTLILVMKSLIFMNIPKNNTYLTSLAVYIIHIHICNAICLSFGAHWFLGMPSNPFQEIGLGSPYGFGIFLATPVPGLKPQEVVQD